MNFEVDPDGGVMQYFDIFFDNNLTDYITNETNHYASQVLRGIATTSTAYKSQHWRDTTVPEMCVFFALIMLQSIVRKPEIVHYWSRRTILSTPFFWGHHFIPQIYETKTIEQILESASDVGGEIPLLNCIRQRGTSQLT
ncbi:hypothetical protein J437_LFUL018432 [Ladona fulva]|uniref:PiggyBac transposable element-derived protein domain-containing protein n=1 Tax=Ladona fulva TaxID=123851 RepID=A0A8K0KQM1_LADFU|nr:hypothetical protein J437_LFUL018432 [Ladona fulva]